MSHFKLEKKKIVHLYKTFFRRKILRVEFVQDSNPKLAVWFKSQQITLNKLRINKIYPFSNSLDFSINFNFFDDN